MTEEHAARAVRRSTIADVAQLAGVDRAVVSRLINNDPRLRIRDDTRLRVLDAIRELDYQPNAAARSLRTSRTGTLAMLVPDHTNPAYAEIIKGAEQAAARVGTLLLTASMESSDDDLRRHLQRLGHGRVDGLLLAAGGTMGTREADVEQFGLPWLCVNRTGPEKRRYVVLDDERATALAVRHLVELGHTRIAFLSGPSDNDSAERRLAGYIRALADEGLGAADVVHADYTSEGGASAMGEILGRDTRPTAVIAANVASAIGALFVARRRGVRVPHDLSVIAIHDLPIAGYLDPPLTTIRMTLDGLGAKAVELLLGRDPAEDVREVMHEPIDLILRESTAKPLG